MAKIYSAPKEVEVPKINFTNFNRKEQDEKDEKYLKDLESYLREHGYDKKNVGEIIRFPVADGHAMYMVASMKPVQLIHIPLWDAWDFEYAHLLTAKEVQLKIDQQKRMKDMFS